MFMIPPDEWGIKISCVEQIELQGHTDGDVRPVNAFLAGFSCHRCHFSTKEKTRREGGREEQMGRGQEGGLRSEYRRGAFYSSLPKCPTIVYRTIIFFYSFDWRNSTQLNSSYNFSFLTAILHCFMILLNFCRIFCHFPQSLSDIGQGDFTWNRKDASRFYLLRVGAHDRVFFD